MRLFRFVIKRGKVGAIAKLAAQAYRQLRVTMPNATEAELLEAIHCIYGSARAFEGKLGWSKLWPHEISDPERIEWRRNNPPANLRDAVIRIVNRDSDFPMTPLGLEDKVFELRTVIREVVEEVLDKDVPEWRDRSVESSSKLPPRIEAHKTTISKPTENPEAVRLFHDAICSQNREEALQKLDLAIQCAPDFEEAWYAKAEILQALGNHEEAIQCYDRVPSSFQAWCNRGVILRRLGRNEMALQSYDRAIALNNRDKVTWLNRGAVLEKLSRSNDALRCYDTALALDSAHSEAWINKGDLLRRLKRYDEALKCFNRGLELNPSDYIGWTNKGRLLSEQEHWEEAVTCFDTALRTNKRFEDAWMEAGICLGELSRFDAAGACFNAVLQLNQGNGYAWHNKGIAILNTYKNYVEAVLCFSQALRLGVKDAEAYLDMCDRKITEDNID